MIQNECHRYVHTYILEECVQKSRHLKLNLVTSGARIYSLFWLIKKRINSYYIYTRNIFSSCLLIWILFGKTAGLYDYSWIQRSFEIAAMSYKSKYIRNNDKHMQSWRCLTMDYFNNKFNGKLWISHVLV